MSESIFKYYNFYPEDVKNSAAWFTKKVDQFKSWRLTPANMFATHGKAYTKRTLKPGKMYFYIYDPKYKEKLPYYDTFPLVLPYDRTDTHFIGLNLHYLDYKMRFLLLHNLMQEQGIRVPDEKARLTYNWGVIKKVAALAPAKACIKQYLFDHVKSPFIEIPPPEWRTAAMLPVQQFQGANTRAIWAESRKIK